MSRSLRHGAIAAVALAAILPLSACAAGNTPETLQIKPDNASTSIGTALKLNNIVVVTAPGADAEHAGPANVTVNISNTGSAPETLRGLELAGAAATFADAKGAPLTEVVIPAGGALLLGGTGQPTAKIASAKVEQGGFAPTTFTFATAGKVSAEAQVHQGKGMYAGFGPSVAPSPAASASATAGASATPSAGASASASPSASASASAGASASASAGASATASPSGSATAASH